MLTSGGSTVQMTNGALALSAASASVAGALSHARLLGLALVVSGDFGTRTPFRYPVPQQTTHTRRGGTKSASVAGGVTGTPTTGGLPRSGSQLDELAVGSAAGSVASSPALGAHPPPLSTATGKDSDDEAAGGGTSATAASTTASASSALLDDMYGMSADEFARLFCPKLALCARVLDVAVDGLRFVSFPVRLRYDEGRSYQARARRKRARARAKARLRANLHAGEGDANAEATADGSAVSASTVSASAAAESVDSAAKPATLSSPSDRRRSSSDVHKTDLDDSNDEDEDSSEEGAASIADEHELTFFNVVFVLSGGVSAGLAAMYGHVAAQLARALLHEQTRAHFVSQQAQLLVAIREKYMHAIQRAAAAQQQQQQQQGARANTGNGIAGNGPVVKTAQPDYHALSHLLLTHSLLANHLHQLYYGLLQQEFERFGTGTGVPIGLGMLGTPGTIGVDDTHGLAAHSGRSGLVASAPQAEGVAAVHAAFTKLGAQLASNSNVATSAATVARNAAARLLQVDHSHTTLVLNNWLPLNFSLSALPPPSASPSSSLITTGTAAHFPFDVAHTTGATLDLRPYQTMFLTVNVPTLLASLPTDCSPLLRRLISAADPRINFVTLASNLRISLAQLYKLVTHLAYWNKCIIGDVIAGDNIYTLSEKCTSKPPVGGGPATTTGRSRAGAVVATQRRSVSARPGSSLASTTQTATNTSTATNNATAGSTTASTTTSMPKPATRRRSSSVETMPAAPHAPSFVPAALLYEWASLFPSSSSASSSSASSSSTLSLLATLARLSAREPRTLAQHLQRLAATMAPSSSSASSSQAHLLGASMSTSQTGSTAASAAASAALAKLRVAVHNEFYAQVLFLLKKQWIVQIHRWFIRIADFSEDEYDATSRSGTGERTDGYGSESDVEHDDLGNERLRPMSRENSRRSLDDLRQAAAAAAAAVAAVSPNAGAVEEDPWRVLLERLSPLYFDGHHTATEILWNERETGLSLGHLQHLVALFPNQLVMVMHP